jgi:hypothetical protein
MKTTAPAPYRMFLVYLLLTFYCFGAAMMAEVVEYRSWTDLGSYVNPAEFASWHALVSARTVPFLVLPMVAATVVALCLLRFLPTAVPRWCLWVVLGCHALAWVSTLLFQLPLEMQLDKGAYSPALMAELWRTDWLRKLAFLIEIPTVTYMAHRFFQHVSLPAAVSVPEEYDSPTPVANHSLT